MIEIRNLTKQYGRVTALDDVSVDIGNNKIVGLLGENGCGKTTLMRILAGLNQPSSGNILVAGHVPGPKTKSLVSYLPDTPTLPGRARIESLIRYFADFYADFNVETCQSLLAQFGILVRDRLQEMSKGQREKVHVALTMSREAQVYLLDEPISGVDPAARDATLNTIITAMRPDALMIITTHLISDIEFVLDDAIFMRHGKLLNHDVVDELRAGHQRSLNDYFKEVYTS